MTPISRAVAAWQKISRRHRRDIRIDLACAAYENREDARLPTLDDERHRRALIRGATALDAAITLLKAAEKPRTKKRKAPR